MAIYQKMTKFAGLTIKIRKYMAQKPSIPKGTT